MSLGTKRSGWCQTYQDILYQMGWRVISGKCLALSLDLIVWKFCTDFFWLELWNIEKSQCYDWNGPSQLSGCKKSLRLPSVMFSLVKMFHWSFTIVVLFHAPPSFNYPCNRQLSWRDVALWGWGQSQRLLREAFKVLEASICLLCFSSYSGKCLNTDNVLSTETTEEWWSKGAQIVINWKNSMDTPHFHILQSFS